MFPMISMIFGPLVLQKFAFIISKISEPLKQ